MRHFILQALLIFMSTSVFAASPWGKIQQDVVTFNELNNEAWQVSAQGTRASIEGFYKNVLEFLGTTEVTGSLMLHDQLSDTDEMQNALQKPFSPLFRQALIDIAIDRAFKMKDRISGFFSVGEDISFRHSVWCVVANRCEEGLTPRYAKTDANYRMIVRQFVSAKYFLAAKFKNVCATTNDLGSAIRSISFLQLLSEDENGISVSLYKPAEVAHEAMLSCISSNEIVFPSIESIIAQSKRYIRF